MMQNQVPAPPSARPSPVRPELPVEDAPPPRRRRRPFIVVGALAIILGSLGGATLVTSADDRINVLALAQDVQAGEKIEAGDLRVAAVAPDPALTTVPAGDRSDMVGKQAASDLKAGSLLLPSHVSDGQGLRKGEDLVAVEIERGMAPTDALRRGDSVKVVSTPGKDGEVPDGDRQPAVEGRVVKVGSSNAAGAVVVQLAVTADDSELVAAQAATGRVALILSSEG